MAPEYHLEKRRRKNGKPVFYVFFQTGERRGNGRPRYRVRSTGTGNKKHAEKVVAQMIREGRVLASPDDLRTFLLDFWTPGKSEHLKRWKARNGSEMSAQYIEAQRSAIDRHFLPFAEKEGVTQLNDLTYDFLDRWQTWCHVDHKASVRTTHRTRQAVWTALRDAVERGKLPYHPGENVKRFSEKRPERPIFERDELQKLFSVEWTDMRAYAACALSESAGMRLGEVRGLQVKNAHVAEGYVDVLTNYVDTEGLKAPKWQPDGRTGIQISPLAADALRRVLADHPHGARPDDFVFADTERDDRPVSKGIIYQALSDATEAAGIEPGRTFHAFRHSAVSHYGALMSPAQRKRYFGHASDAMSEHYSHETEDDREKLREAHTKVVPFRQAK